MNLQTEIDAWIAAGKLRSELELERASIAERKLRLLSKQDPELGEKRKVLRALIERYEKENWLGGKEISDEQILESDRAERMAELEGQFIQRRKELIRSRLKELKLTQQDFGKLLGHPNKSYISELMNGVNPFSQRDLVVIHHLLKIDLADLVPTFLSIEEIDRLRIAAEELGNPNISFQTGDLSLV